MKTLNNAKLGIVSLFLGASVSFAAAQAKPGDYVFTGLQGKIVSMDATSGTTSTLGSLSGAWANAATMGPANYWNYVIKESSSGDAVLQVSPRTGSVGTVTTLPAAGQKSGIAVDIDGAVLVTSDNGYLYRTVSRTVTTLASGLGQVNAICIDGDTGHYVLGIADRKILLRVDRNTRRKTTLARGVGMVTGVAHHPHTGHFIVTNSTGPLQIFNRSGGLVRSLNGAPDNAVCVDGATGDIIAVGLNRLIRYDRNLNPKFTRTTKGVPYPTGVSIYDSRKLAGSGSLTKGSVFTVKLRFNDSPNANYGGALVTRGMRPGIPVSGRKINVNFNDPLLYLTSSGALEGLFTQGINGTLSSGGVGTIRVAIPQFMPAGTSLYLVCNAVNGKKPGGLDFGNTICITPK